jgi:uncharacterized protein (TIGR00725 family)
VTRRALVAVIGDAGVREGAAAYDMARDVGRLVIDAGYRLVTGGLGGVMEAACRGAHESSAYREGDTIGFLPSAGPDEANPWVDIAIATDLGSARNVLVARSNAVIAIGGGAGTLSEIAFAWMHRRLVVALTLEGWSGELAGRTLDHRAHGERVYEATNAEAALEVVRRVLPSYMNAPSLRR